MPKALHTLESEQLLPISLDEAWQYFSNPLNLEELTPKGIGFKILTCSDDTMTEGQIISYKIKVIPIIWLSWVTEITHMKSKQYFIDDQRHGPYKIWHHRHSFEEVEGGVLMKDLIHYALPFGIFGNVAHALFVRKKLEQIFEYRKTVLNDKFSL